MVRESADEVHTRERVGVGRGAAGSIHHEVA